MENPEIPGRIQMERFIPVEIFPKKSNTIGGISLLLEVLGIGGGGGGAVCEKKSASLVLK